MRIVIVGNGPAALAAIEAIRDTDTDSEITVLSGEAERAYTPCFLAKYVAGTVEAADLALKCDDFYEKMDVKLLTGKAVTSVVPDEKAVVLEDGSTIGYDRLLLACGAEPVTPESPDLTGPGVFYFRSLADATAIRTRAQGAHDVVVLGSGFVAMEIAEALAEIGATVSVVARTDHILRRVFDAEVADLVEDHMSTHGVRFVKCCNLVDVERDDKGELKAAVLSSGERVPVQMLVVGVGMRPNDRIVTGTQIAVATGILTDDAMRTSVTDIWAAGDVAEVEIGGVRKANLIHPSAVAGGRVAGCNMVGGEERLSAHLHDMNVLTVFGRAFMAIGALEGETVLRHAVGSERLVKVFADAEGVIEGVELVGDVTRGGLYASLIARGVRVGEMPDVLSPSFNYGQTLAASGGGS